MIAEFLNFHLPLGSRLFAFAKAAHALSALDEALTGSQLYKSYTIEQKKRTQPVWPSP